MPPPPRRLHNLPTQLTTFIGREQEIAEVKHLLGTARLLTLTGAGGCGKTRLALQVASDILGHYPDGIWFVEFASIADPALVPKMVASALDVLEQPSRAIVDTLLDLLRPKALLLVLDNCEHLLAACADLAMAVLRTCPQVRVLATSREGLRIPGETLWRVPSLCVPQDIGQLPPAQELVRYDAVRLFVDRAAATTPGFAVTSENASAVAQVCQRLDGIPLAIELAAARVKVLAAQQIAERLDDRFRLLMGDGRFTLPRHQTLRAAIDWSYNLASEPERVLLRRLSVFAGGWTLEAAEAICAGNDIAAHEVLDLLAHLVDRSLVIAEPQSGESRYRLLETIRQYGRDRLEETDETVQVRIRHRDWYLQLAELAEPKLRTAEQDIWVPRLEAEHDNLRAALAWSLLDRTRVEGRTRTNADLGLRLVAALWWFWFIRDHYSEGRRWLEQALAASEGASLLRARALLGRGVLTIMEGDLSGGTALLEKSLRLSQAVDDRLGIASATGWLGVPALYAGDNERALTHFQESLVLRRQLGDAWGIALMTQSVGAVFAGQGDMRGVPLLDEALMLCRKVGDKWVTGLTLLSAATGALARRDTEKATVHIEESLLLFRRLRDRRGTARALGILGQIARIRGDYAQAAAMFRESLALFREIGDKRGIALCFERLGSAASVGGRLEQAARLFGAADALREAIGVVPATSGPGVPAPGGAGDRAVVRTNMGDAAFANAWTEGRAMTLEEAVEHALATAQVPARENEEPKRSVPAGKRAGLLAPRERAVAALIVEGKTNREIASSLSITESTAETHVQHILNKLGFNSRVQIAAWAISHGLHPS